MKFHSLMVCFNVSWQRKNKVFLNFIFDYLLSLTLTRWTWTRWIQNINYHCEKRSTSREYRFIAIETQVCISLSSWILMIRIKPSTFGIGISKLLPSNGNQWFDIWASLWRSDVSFDAQCSIFDYMHRWKFHLIRIFEGSMNITDLHSSNEKYITLKALFNIVGAPFKRLLNFDVCVVWWCSDGPINSQEYNIFDIHAVTNKISMTEYHHWINRRAYHLFSTQQSMGRN